MPKVTKSLSQPATSLTKLNTRLVKFAFRGQDNGRWLLADIHIDFTSLPRESALSPSSEDPPSAQVYFTVQLTNSRPREWGKSVVLQSPLPLEEIIGGRVNLAAKILKSMVLGGRLREKDLRIVEQIFRDGLYFDGDGVYFLGADTRMPNSILFGKLGDEHDHNATRRIRNGSPTSNSPSNSRKGMSPRMKSKLRNAKNKVRYLSAFNQEKIRNFDQATPEERLNLMQQRIRIDQAASRAKRLQKNWHNLQDGKMIEPTKKQKYITLEELQYMESFKNQRSVVKHQIVEFNPNYTQKYEKYLRMKILNVIVLFKFEIFTYCLKQYVLFIAYR